MSLRPALLSVFAVGMFVGGCVGLRAPDEYFVEIPGVGETRIDVPRPSSGAADCTLAIVPGESIAERAAGLREAGLFATQSDLDDGALGARVEAGITRDWGEVPLGDDPYLEFYVAEQDRSRVWWRDLEADVIDGNDVYEAALEEWAAISEGAFAPSAITEHWASETGPIEVGFQLAGATHTLSPGYLEDWIDPRILGAINELIAPSGRQFRMVAPFDQSAIVLAVTPQEQAALETRGWCFT